MGLYLPFPENRPPPPSGNSEGRALGSEVGQVEAQRGLYSSWQRAQRLLGDLLKISTGQETTERPVGGLCSGFSSLGKLSSVMDGNSKNPKAVRVLGRFTGLEFVPTVHKALC